VAQFNLAHPVHLTEQHMTKLHDSNGLT